ncbi:MAG: dihydroorotase [Candidatus Omnitrophica bacterium]|nr:dihydroorotase [Candidatus Omnitrophota bacterium]MCM8825925.1 dihydroorotase [Candidatus Omnitrophota bacterium]
MKILIKSATIVNSKNTILADILIENGRIAKLDRNIKENADREIDAKDKFVLPGLIDLHAHLRTPGREDEEDLISGSCSAAKGGFTTILCMPNTNPCIDNEGVVEWIREESQKIGIVDIIPIGAITKERKGKELSEFGVLKKAGCLALSDDSDSIDDSYLFRRALEYAKMFNLLIISHCEDKNLSSQGAMRESLISAKYGMSSIPDIAETIRVFRDIEIAKYVNTKLHLAHISCKKSIELIRREKETFPYLTCETSPHYFILTVEDVEKSNFHANFKVNPPLGERNDVEEIRKAIKEGVIDCIATDHAPHSFAEKEAPFENAPFGFVGLELAFSLTYTYLVREKIISFNQLVEKLSYNPANILGLKDRGEIRKDAIADLIIVDVNKSWQVISKNLVSKSKNTPFLNSELMGLVELTIHQGKIVYEKPFFPSIDLSSGE